MTRSSRSAGKDRLTCWPPPCTRRGLGRERPPLQWHHGLLLCVLLLQAVVALIFVMRRLLRRSLLLFASAAMTLVILILWTGHDLASRPGMTDLLRWP